MENITKTDGKKRVVVVHPHRLPNGNRGDAPDVNSDFFMQELRGGMLDKYRGMFVAYQKGFLCGSGNDMERLYETASEAHGQSGLAVFRVPKKSEEQKPIQAKGRYTGLFVE